MKGIIFTCEIPQYIVESEVAVVELCIGMIQHHNICGLTVKSLHLHTLCSMYVHMHTAVVVTEFCIRNSLENATKWKNYINFVYVQLLWMLYTQLIIVPMVTTDKLYMYDDLQIEVCKIVKQLFTNFPNHGSSVMN